MFIKGVNVIQTFETRTGEVEDDVGNSKSQRTHVEKFSIYSEGIIRIKIDTYFVVFKHSESWYHYHALAIVQDTKTCEDYIASYSSYDMLEKDTYKLVNFIATMIDADRYVNERTGEVFVKQEAYEYAMPF